MTGKAGCRTHILCNGLDAEKMKAVSIMYNSRITLIMAYTIKNATFVHITQTRDYTFTDIWKYSVHNTNAFLDMKQE